jgi:nucleotide-binding universal stress UspA family protein
MDLVLAGDDGSSQAEGAVGWARRFAEAREAELVVVRVTGAGQDAPADKPPDGASLVRDSHPASGIMIAADERDADLLVLGRRGQGGFPSLPIGTTAHHVAAASGRPVVVVPPMPELRDGPVVQRVVVGVDGLPGSLEAAAWAVRNFGDAEFTVIHALELAPAFAQAGDVDDDVYGRARARAVARLEDAWTGPFTDAGVTFDVVVEEGGPAEVLLGGAARLDADLVVVGRRDHAPMRGTLGGTSQRVLAYAPCAAAVVPLPEG